MSKLYDKNRREIMVNDVLKVFHFTGSRRKKYYMYKHVIDTVLLGDNMAPAFKISHLCLNSKKGSYIKLINDTVLEDFEIVQGFGNDHTSFEDRPKLAQTETKGGS